MSGLAWENEPVVVWWRFMPSPKMIVVSLILHHFPQLMVIGKSITEQQQKISRLGR
jgi:hypothetical protein